MTPETTKPAKPPKLLVDTARGAHYIQAYKEGKGRNAEYVVKVWKNKATPDGEPDGDWAMPSVLGVEVSIAQAIVQT